MFCAKCGKEMEEGAGFCSACGAPVRAAGEQQVPAVGAQPPADEPLESPLLPGPPLPEQTGEAYAGEFVEAPKRRISIPALIVIAVVVVALLSAAIIVPMVIASKNSQKKAQTRTCQANQRTVDAAIITYGAMSPDENYPSSLDDLAAEGVLNSIPTCPSGNLPYIWVEGEIGSPPTISCPNDAGHAL